MLIKKLYRFLRWKYDLVLNFKKFNLLIVRHYRDINIVIKKNGMRRGYSFSWYWMFNPKNWYWKPNITNIINRNERKWYRMIFLGCEYNHWGKISSKRWIEICEKTLGVRLSERF